jgi:RNA polymerase-binding transcription factor DksA
LIKALFTRLGQALGKGISEYFINFDLRFNYFKFYLTIIFGGGKSVSSIKAGKGNNMNKARSQKTTRKKTIKLKGRWIKLLTAGQLTKKSSLVKGNKYFTISQAREKRDLLLRLRERITGQINFLATDNLSRSEKDNEVSYRSEEQGTDNFDRDFALNRLSLDQELLYEVDDALNRLAMGTYGICDGCGRGIEKSRLKALPYSRMCVACQSRSESGKKQFKTFDSTAVFHNTEKAAGEAGSDEE